MCSFLFLRASVKLSKLLAYPTDGNFNCSISLFPNLYNCFPYGHFYAKKCKLFWKFKFRKSYIITDVLVQFTCIHDQIPRLTPECRIPPFRWHNALYTVLLNTVIDKARRYFQSSFWKRSETWRGFSPGFFHFEEAGCEHTNNLWAQ